MRKHFLYYSSPLRLQLFSKLLLITLTLIAISCAPHKGYPGDIRPDEELSYLYFQNEEGASIFSIAVDDQVVNVFSSGIKVLPGDHSLVVTGTVTENVCHNLTSSYCFNRTRSMICELKLSTEGGATYRVQMMGLGVGASLRVLNEDLTHFYTSTACIQQFL